MDEELKNRLDTLEKKTDAIYVSVEKTQKYFLWTLVATVVMFVLPLLGVVLVLPWFVGTITSAYGL